MSSQHIYLGQHMNGPGSAQADWIAANDVNPSDVAYESVAEVHDGHVTFVVFALCEGRKVIAKDRYEKEFLTVPLKSGPEQFGL